MGKLNVYEIVTNQILDALKEDVVPWRKPWRSGLHKNVVRNYTYRGVNQFLCEYYMMQNEEYELPYWLTYKNAQEKGGNVKKGEKGHIVVFWQQIVQEDEDNPEEEPKVFGFYRYYKVFNAAQIEGMEFPPLSDNEHTPIEAAELAIKEMPNPPKMTFGGDAWYAPKPDKVNVPKPEMFDDSDAYYATTFHELAHSTGHEKRLAREGIMDTIRFGSEDYSKEELIAEMTSAMLCAQTGIDPSTRDRSASYIKNWLKKLNDDPKFVVQAASKAHRASEYIMGQIEQEKED
jgi:antirestriction protein ArdC